jgi:hypothetical protein
MAGLLDKPEVQAPPPPAEPVAEPAPAEVAAEGQCRTCAAPLVAGQDWCLECGTAVPGRLGARPGWRAALTVVALTGLLVTGAAAAAYAALTSEARREAAAPPPPAAAPIQAQAPAPEPPPPAAKPVDPPAAGDEPAPPPADDTPDAPPADDAAVAPAPITGGGSSGGDSGSDDGGGESEATLIDVPASRASTYDPDGVGGDDVGDADDAVDGKRSTAWEAPVGEDGLVGMGIALDLGRKRDVSRLEMLADTPGFTVDVYGSKARRRPPAQDDPGWKRLDTARDVGLKQDLDLDGEYRHILVWVREQPADATVAIAELRLFG